MRKKNKNKFAKRGEFDRENEEKKKGKGRKGNKKKNSGVKK